LRSAYAVLGVPGNASNEEIEAAFERGRALYSPERLASTDGAVDKFNELKTAYSILRAPDSRAAHDRKLSGAARPAARAPVAVVAEEIPASHQFMKWGLILVVVVFGVGAFVSYKNAEARRQQAALELEQKQQEAREKEAAKAEAVRAELERAQAKAKTEADERRFQVESRVAAQRATAEYARQDAAASQMQRQAAMEAQRQDAARSAEERRNVIEAQRRVEADKRRIRELCLQQYRRPDC
jgi:curved DNA-binding protein CbpA